MALPATRRHRQATTELREPPKFTQRLNIVEFSPIAFRARLTAGFWRETALQQDQIFKTSIEFYLIKYLNRALHIPILINWEEEAPHSCGQGVQKRETRANRSLSALVSGQSRVSQSVHPFAAARRDMQRVDIQVRSHERG